MSWKRGSLDLHPGVNIIYGVSDKGKSAILKAIDWLRNNRPLGDEFASDWIKKKTKKDNETYTGICSCELTLDDDIRVKRSKGKDTNQYELNTLKEPLKAFNKEIPEEIVSALNISDINVQEQGNPIFLLKDSPSDIGRTLNQIASLSDIDKAFKNINGKIKRINGDLKADNKIIKENQEQEKSFDWINDAELQLKEIEILSGNLKKATDDEHYLRTNKDKWIELQQKIDDFDGFEKAYKLIIKTFQIKEQSDKLNTEVENLIEIENQIKKQSNNISLSKKLLEAERDFESLRKLIIKRENLTTEKDRMIDDHNRFIDADDDLHDIKIDLDDAKEKYDKIKPDDCPMCGKPW